MFSVQFDRVVDDLALLDYQKMLSKFEDVNLNVLESNCFTLIQGLKKSKKKDLFIHLLRSLSDRILQEVQRKGTLGTPRERSAESNQQGSSEAATFLRADHRSPANHLSFGN